MWLRSKKRNKSVKSATNLHKEAPLQKSLRIATASAAATLVGCVVKQQQKTKITSHNSYSNKTVKTSCVTGIKASVKRLGKRTIGESKKKVTTSTSVRRISNRHVQHLARNRSKCDATQNAIEATTTLYTVVNLSNYNLKSRVSRAKNKNNCKDNVQTSIKNAKQTEDGGGKKLNRKIASAATLDANSSEQSDVCSICETCDCSCESGKKNNSSKNNDCVNYSKCISECDSTTDYDRRELPSTSGEHSANILQKLNEIDVVDPEIDSTTDLLPSEPFSNVPCETPIILNLCHNNNSQLNSKDLLELPILSSPSLNISFPNNSPPNLTQSCKGSTFASTSSSCRVAENQFNESDMTEATVSGSAVPNYSTASDLISTFDEEMNKGSTNVCQYSDFFPYNNVITQALLNCNEVINVCEQNYLPNNLQTDIAFLSSMNPTTMANLKALTNLQTHTNNFLSMPNKSGYNESMDTENDDNICTDGMIHSIEPSSYNLYTHQQLLLQSQDNVVMQQSQNKEDDIRIEKTNEIQLETDERLDVDDSNERQKELLWDAFDPYVFIKNLPPLTADMRAKCPALPLKTRSSPEFNLVLDLDETLVHCSLQELTDASFKFPVLFQVKLL